MYTYLEFQIAYFKFLNVEFGWRSSGFHIGNMRPDIHLERTEFRQAHISNNQQLEVPVKKTWGDVK